MENKSKITLSGVIVFAVLAASLVVALTVSAYDHDQTYNANSAYFVPEDVRVPGYCEDTTVAIWTNTSVAIASGWLVVDYTQCCADVTDFQFNTINWQDPNCAWYDDSGQVRILFLNDTANGPGPVHIGDLTIHCCNDSDLGHWDDELGCCFTNLAWNTGESYLEDDMGGEITPVGWKDGTFMCGNPIEVNKTVWNGTAWVNEITDADINETYKFRCLIHSKCQNMYNIYVTDKLSDSLEYVPGSAKIDSTPLGDPTPIGPNEYMWDLSWVGTLNACDTINITFDTKVVDYGYDCNNQTAYAECEDCLPHLRVVSAWDTACIDVPLPAPDLIVESITPNCGYLFGNESNGICAKITNNGADANASNASFVLSDGYNEIVGVPALAAGTNTTVCATDPTIRNAGAVVNINVTADCNGEIGESNETNNASDIDVTVVNNGYKGKRYTGGEDINTWKTFELQGDLLYSLGDSYYLSASATSGYPHWTTYNTSWNTSDLPVDSGTVEEARLYVMYTWDTKGVIPTHVDMSFNGNPQTLDADYSDEKGWATSYPYGMLAYNVTDDFNTSGNVANLTNSYPGGGNVSMRGMLLVVIYADDSEPLREIYINEEFDMLGPKCATPEEATAYAPFGVIDPSTINSATLITVAPGANKVGTDKQRLIFNDQTWAGVWGFTTNAQIAIDERDVTPYLNSTDNEAGFQDNGDWMEASNAFLVLEKAGVRIGVEFSPENDITVQPQEQFDANITIEALGTTKVYGVEYYLVYNKSVVRAETQNKGPFLGGFSDTIVVINDVDQANGIVSYAETRKVTGGVDGKDTVATIQFTAIGARGTMSALDLFDVIVVDEDKNEVPSVIITDGTVTINDNIPPTANGTSKHEFNNVAKKYPCNTLLCSCSYDDNYPDKGGNITYIRWAFGDGQYGTTEGLPVNNCTCKEHKYESWQWDSDYVPFNVSLTVTDDGCPEETDTTFFEVNVFIAGDASGDGRVNILDAVYIGKHWSEGCPPADPCVECYSYLWGEQQQDKADLNNDCDINILDAVTVGANWGHTAW